MLRTFLRTPFMPPVGVICGKVQVRTNKIMRTPPTDTTKLIPLLDETQWYVPVVHRRHAVPLRKINVPSRRLRRRHYVYDEVTPPSQPMPDVEVILVCDVPGKGVKGTKLKIEGQKAYAELLAPQFAVYASPENEAKYADLIENVQKNAVFSTLTAQKTAHQLSQCMVFFFMNMKNPWTIEKWHARVAFRQSGIMLSEDCIELPSQPVTGPDAEKEGKHFLTTVIINGKERVPVLCRINHFINDEAQKIPVEAHFKKPIEPIFEADRKKIDDYVHQRALVKEFKF